MSLFPVVMAGTCGTLPLLAALTAMLLSAKGHPVRAWWAWAGAVALLSAPLLFGVSEAAHTLSQARVSNLAIVGSGVAIVVGNALLCWSSGWSSVTAMYVLVTTLFASSFLPIARVAFSDANMATNLLGAVVLLIYLPIISAFAGLTGVGFGLISALFAPRISQEDPESSESVFE